MVGVVRFNYMWIKGTFLVFVGVGVFVLMQVISPIIAFKSWEIFYYNSNQLLADPLSSSGHSGGTVSSGNILGVSVSNVNNFPAFYSNNSLIAPYKEFNLTIPKMDLVNARVRTYSNDFEESPASLPGTAMPGERGNVFVSGHSSIARKFEVKGQKAWFANLSNLKKGDDVQVIALGQKYNYEVIGSRIVDPKDVEVIDPPDNEGRYLTLMTCVPPGFNTKRLIVLSKLKG